MKKSLFPDNGQFYKANLHAHSTVSDGVLTPQELKERYKAKGYQILAITDHELMVEHSDLDDEDFLTITGMEYAFFGGKYNVSPTIELNFYAKDQKNTTHVCFNPRYVLHGEKWRADVVERLGEPFLREYTVECIQKVIDAAKANGFLVSLNHPGWSMESPEFFGSLEGLFAMEIYNHLSFVYGGVMDYNPAMYENMLRRGKNLYCIAADDCHGGGPDDSPYCDRYGGFVMIHAPKLDYASVMHALEQGDFYASQGPLIHDLYIEDGQVHLHCSPARAIAMNTAHRPFGGVRIAPEGELLTEAVFKLPEGQPFMRFDVIDDKGRHANTRAYPTEG